MKPLVATVLCLASLGILIGLGTWQVERKAWKENLIATLEQRLSDAPVALPPRSEWPSLAGDQSEFTRVRARVAFVKGADVLVFTGASAVRDDVKSPGYFVFSLARTADGGQVLVNRGFVPDKNYPAAPAPDEIVGVIRLPERPSWFVSAHDAAGEVWTVRDPAEMARVKGWGEVAPFYIEQEAPVPPGGLPHPARLTVNLRNEHLQYIITWYGLAAVLAVMMAVWAMRRRGGRAA